MAQVAMGAAARPRATASSAASARGARKPASRHAVGLHEQGCTPVRVRGDLRRSRKQRARPGGRAAAPDVRCAASPRSTGEGAAASSAQEAPLRSSVVGATLAASLMLSPVALPLPAEAYTVPDASTPSAAAPGALGKAEVPDDDGASFVLDYAKVLSRDTKTRINGELAALKESTGWKVTVLTSAGEQSAPPIRALQQYWRVDSKTIIVSVDEFKGNVLEFYYDSVNPTVKATIPKNVFQELRGRYGNVYYLREEGVQSVVEEVSGTLRGCLERGGCNYVPGLSQQQREFSLVAVTSGAFLSGAVLRNGLSRWSYIFLFIWVPWIGLFGFWPLYFRQPENLIPLFENIAVFVTIFAFMWLTPLIGDVSLPDFLKNLGKVDTGSEDTNINPTDAGGGVELPKSSKVEKDDSVLENEVAEPPPSSKKS